MVMSHTNLADLDADGSYKWYSSFSKLSFFSIKFFWVTFLGRGWVSLCTECEKSTSESLAKLLWYLLLHTHLLNTKSWSNWSTSSLTSTSASNLAPTGIAKQTWLITKKMKKPCFLNDWLNLILLLSHTTYVSYNGALKWSFLLIFLPQFESKIIVPVSLWGEHPSMFHKR